MSQYQYSSLSRGPESIRLLRLMPHEHESTERTKIHCELFEYNLRDLGKGTHLYEALSYTWGDSEKSCSIFINKQKLGVTKNLYAALLRLQDRSLGRILWVDAVCINQNNSEEQGQQVQLMAKIYSKAHRVIVWLGKETVDTEGALGDICLAANEDTERSKKEINQQVILNLLRRPWFRRVWVLQEVAAARHVVMICGSIEIDGYAFCLGLKALNLPYTDYPELQTLPSVTYLIKQAGLRPKHITDSLERFSLGIRHLDELIDMFHTREASDNRDKVYALLGMSSDNPVKAGLRPDYTVSWKDLFQQLVEFILGKDVSVETNDSQRAVINGRGCILGRVSSVSDDRQNVNITSTNTAWHTGDKIEWTLQASSKPIQERDIVCFLQGASKPTIIRLCKDHFAIVVIAVTPLNESESFKHLELSKSRTQFPRDFLLVWDLEKSPGRLQDQEEYESLANTNSQAEFRDPLDKATRTWDFALLLGDSEEYEKAEERLREAIKSYEIGFGEEHPRTLKSQYGLTPLSWAAGNGYNAVAKLLLTNDSVDPDLKDSQYGQTPLSWAAEGGHEAVVKLLLETGKVDVNSQDKDGTTPLWWAANGRHKAVVMLLLETGKVDIEAKDWNGWTPLYWAARGGHEAIVKLLLETGKVNLESKDIDGQTSLWWAAYRGHQAIVKLLLETGMVDVESKDIDGRTSLWWAAYKGHEAIVKLLLKTGKVNLESKDINGRTSLWWAAYRGYEALVKLLLETGKVDVNSKDKDGTTPLWQAVEEGHEVVIKLLLEACEVDVNSRDKDGQAPLWRAVNRGHDAVIKLLLETGKVNVSSKDDTTPLWQAVEEGRMAVIKLLLETGVVDVNSRDKDGRTLLLWAISERYKDIVMLLLKTGKVSVESKDRFGRTSLSRAAGERQEAVVKLLLETGKVDVNSKDNYGQTPLSWAVLERHEAVVRLLVETGMADVESKDKLGWTPLLRATRDGHEAIVKLLQSSTNSFP